MMLGFGHLVAFEISQAAIGGAIGVAHDEHAPSLVQADRHADLVQDEILLESSARGSESLRAAGDDDHVGALDDLLLQKLSHCIADAVVEAAEDGSIGYVRVGGGVEMEDLFHGDL